jgi:hypothetical protein
MDRATAATLSRIASLNEVVVVSLVKDSPITLAPPETLNTIGTLVFGSTDVRRTPLVHMIASE